MVSTNDPPARRPSAGSESSAQLLSDFVSGVQSSALADALPHLVWFARSDGEVVFYNRRAELYDGITPGADGVYQWAPIVHPEDLDRTRRAWLAAIDTQEPYECEHRIRMKDGTFRVHVSRALPIATTDGMEWFGTATDTQIMADTRDALAESESRLRSVFAGIDQGYCICELVMDGDGHPVDYRFIETNAQFEAATGLAEAAGRTALDLVPNLEPHWVDTYASIALGGEPVRFQQTSLAMGRRFDVFAIPVLPRGRFALVFSDITERHAALAALHESEARFRNMADHTPVMVWVTDPDGDCSYLNRRWYEFTGQSEAEALGQGWLDAAHPDDRDRCSRAFLEATARQAAFSLDYRLRRHDGEYRWAVDAAAPRFSDDGRFLGYVGSVMDITDRKNAEQAIADQRDREHEIAVRLQESMLPSELVRDPHLEIAAAYVAGAELLQVGGDWYETFHTADHRIGVAVGDVVGHNTDAAAAMGQLRAGLLALATQASNPAQLLRELDLFAQRYRITDYATAVCLFIDPRTGAVDYSSAGHPPAMISPREGPVRWLDGAISPPLGLQPTASRTFASETLEPNSILVAYSDGLIERRGESLDEGLDRLSNVVRRHHRSTMQQLCSETVAALAGPSGYEDDTALISLRRAA